MHQYPQSLPGRDSEEGWIFPVMDTGWAALLQPRLAMQMCPPNGIWHLSPCFGEGVLTWDHGFALITGDFVPAPQGVG